MAAHHLELSRSKFQPTGHVVVADVVHVAVSAETESPQSQRTRLHPLAGHIERFEVHVSTVASESVGARHDAEESVLLWSRALRDVHQHVAPRLHEVEALAEDIPQVRVAHAGRILRWSRGSRGQ